MNIVYKLIFVDTNKPWNPAVISKTTTTKYIMPKKKKGDPNKPKRGLTAFMFYSAERRPEIKIADPDLASGEVAKQIGVEWREFKDAKKVQYQKKSDKDKARYVKEMESYEPPESEFGKKKVKRKRDPDAPKRSKSAYMFFVSERRSALVKLHPEWTFGEYGKAMGEEWRNVTASGRKKWDKMSAADKVRYDAEKKAYVPTGNV